MKKAIIVFAVLVLSMSLMAQQRAGTVYGKVLDAEKNPLPGVTVTLNGPAMAPLTTVTGETGQYRFPSIPPGKEYIILAELQGFKTVRQPSIVVTIGASTEIDVTMEVGKLEEQITVTASSPVVDTKKTTVSTNFNNEEMQSLPTARDPWVVMQMAPAIMLDRENIGGNESGQQSTFLAKGDMANNGYAGSNNIWSVDGIDITDPAAQGGSALYYDFDMFEEMNITTGGAADVTVQTGGIALNMVTRRGGNKMSLAGRFYLTDNFFQSENLTPELKAQGILNTNKIQQIKDYGFNAGGPLLKDKVWWWGAYGVQDIFVYTVYATQDKTLLNNYNFKINAQLLANNRFEALVTSGAKEKFGRNASVSKPEGDHQQGKYHWGSPIIKLQDEHVFGNNLYLSLKYSFNDAGFGWKPMVDEALANPQVYDNTTAKYVPFGFGFTATSWGSYAASRPRNNYQLNGTYFNDTFLGLSHEIKVGAEYSHKVAAHHWGTFQGYSVTKNYNTAALDTNKDGTRAAAEMVGSGWQRLNWWRDGRDNGVADQYAFYLQDTITKGNFTATLGLRYDKQQGSQGAVTYGAGQSIAANPVVWSIFDSTVTTQMDTILPGVSADPVKANPQILGGGNSPYEWNNWSPRLGITWDISGDGKTVAKLALSQYGDVMGTGYASGSPQGTGGSSNFWWMDGGYGQNNSGAWVRTGTPDGKVTLDELYWMYSSTTTIPGAVRYQPYQVFPSGSFNSVISADLVANGYNSDPYKAGNVGGYDWNNKTFLDYSNITWWVDKKSTQSSTRTSEILMTLEREIIPDFAVAITGSYRKYDNNDIGMTYYPAEVNGEPTMYDGMIDPGGLDLTDLIIDPGNPPSNGPWYVEAGTQPSSIFVNFPLTNPADPASAPVYPWGTQDATNVEIVQTGPTTYVQQVTYGTAGAAGRPFYLPASYYPITGTPYSVTRKGTNYTTYMGIDFVLTKRLSNKWFMNASFTWQDQKSYWGSDYFNPTDKWAYDGQPFGNWGGGASGKVAVLMYTTWMAKLSGLYQLPYGFDISGTINAREGWKIPHWYDLEIDPDAAPNSAYYGTSPSIQTDVTDSLPTFINVTLRLEKRVNVGAGRLYFMADVFNLFNAATVNRAYNAYMGWTQWSGTGQAQIDQAPNTTYRRYNEILNPRVWRFGMRFEF